MKTFINFDNSMYKDTLSGSSYLNICNKKYKPSVYTRIQDLTYDTILEPNDTWFLSGYILNEFLSQLHINQNIIISNNLKINIILHHADCTFDETVFKQIPEYINKIFSINNTAEFERSIAIPLGLGPPDEMGGIGAPLAKDIEEKDTLTERTKLLYVNFRPRNYPQERTPLCGISLKILNGQPLKIQKINHIMNLKVI